jgi:glycosyltransferase involved in cell wall biosynthesis
VTLIPSLCGEGTSLAALESMACGTPCVGTSVAGLLDLPVLHAEPEPRAIAHALAHALDARDALAARQREAVTRDYSLERWRASWLRVARSVADGA